MTVESAIQLINSIEKLLNLLVSLLDTLINDIWIYCTDHLE